MRRSMVVFLVATIAIIGLGYLVFLYLIVEEPRPRTTKIRSEAAQKQTMPAPFTQKGGVEVISVQGTVERRQSVEQAWKLISPGDWLMIEESVKTGKGASAKLRVDGKSQIDLKSRSELSVQEITDTVHRFKLFRGRIGVSYDASGARSIKIESSDSDTVAEAKAGEFQVQNAEGIVSVATTTGEVKLTAKHKTVLVQAGKISRVRSGKQPAEPMDIPVSVLLQVVRPKRFVQSERFTYVRGKTTVGARVFVNDIPAKVAKNGRFRVRVPLKLGRNRIVVTSEDVAGNVERAELPFIIVKNKAPIKRMELIWDNQGTQG